MQDCWREDPDDRPTFENLRDELKEMENQHQVTCEHLLSLLKFPIPYFARLGGYTLTRRTWEITWS